MEKYLSKNQFKIFAAFKKNCRGIDVIENNNYYSDVDLNETGFREKIYKMLSQLSFQEYKDNKALLIDTLDLYTTINYPMDPDISIKLNLFQNEENYFFLEIIYR